MLNAFAAGMSLMACFWAIREGDAFFAAFNGVLFAVNAAFAITA